MSQAPDPQATPGVKSRLAKHLAIYTVARLLLFVALTGIILGISFLFLPDGMPLLLAAMLGLLMSLPVSMLLFKKMRATVNKDIAVIDERRRRDKADLRAKLSGQN